MLERRLQNQVCQRQLATRPDGTVHDGPDRATSAPGVVHAISAMFRSPGGIAMDRTTEMLSSLVCDLHYNDLTPQTVHQVKRALVDTVACAMGGYRSEPAKIARQLASTVKSAGEHGSRILGTRDSSSPELAGFANAVMVRYLDYNDMSVGGHPSDSIPGPLAMAYPRGSNGRAVITSMVVNYEVARQVGSHVQHTFQLGWDHGILRALGAACATGKIMGLDRERMGHAISVFNPATP
jgi:2-methylcitrate dehydratase